MAKITSASRLPEGRVTRARSQTPQPTGQPGQDGDNVRRRKRPRTDKTHDLIPVDEVDELPQAGQALEIPSPPSLGQEAMDVTGRASIHSGISGTTAKTSFSQEELEELDGEIMVDSLNDLADSAAKLVRLLLPVDRHQQAVMRKEIRIAGSRQQKRFNVSVATLELHRQNFGRTDYLQPHIILRALLGVVRVEDVPHGPWRPDAIIYRINLAQMLRSIFVTINDNAEVDTDAYEALEKLDAYFPTAIGGAAFDDDAFNLHLNLLIQLCITRLAVFVQDPAYDPQTIIQDTFYNPSFPDEDIFRHSSDHHLHELANDQQDECRDAISDIIGVIQKLVDDARDPLTAIRTLKAQYPWSEFVDRVATWVQERAQQLDAEITAAGGLDRVIENLQDQVERKVLMREADQKRQSITSVRSTPKKTLTGLKSLKQREKRLAQSTAPVPVAVVIERQVSAVAPPPATAPVDNDWVPLPEIDDDSDQAQADPNSTIPSRQDIVASYTQAQRQDALKTERRFVDRQSGAHRVAWDDESQPQPQPQPTAQPATHLIPSAQSSKTRSQTTPSSSSKRPHEEIDDDDDDDADDDDEDEDFEPTPDDGFQVDTRDMQAANERRRAAPQQTQRSAVDPIFTSSANTNDRGTAAVVSGNQSRPALAERRNPGSSIPPPLPPVDVNAELQQTAGDRFQEIKTLARFNTVTSTVARQQNRVPWSGEEEGALLTLIEEYGVGWTIIKNMDAQKGPGEEKLAQRSAENLREKARNMRLSFEKSRMPLPKNFELIRLAAGQLGQLRKLGIYIDQDPMRMMGQ